MFFYLLINNSIFHWKLQIAQIFQFHLNSLQSTARSHSFSHSCNSHMLKYNQQLRQPSSRPTCFTFLIIRYTRSRDGSFEGRGLCLSTCNDPLIFDELYRTQQYVLCDIEWWDPSPAMKAVRNSNRWAEMFSYSAVQALMKMRCRPSEWTRSPQGSPWHSSVMLDDAPVWLNHYHKLKTDRMSGLSLSFLTVSDTYLTFRYVHSSSLLSFLRMTSFVLREIFAEWVYACEALVQESKTT